MSEPQLRRTVQLLMSELRHKTALVDKLTHETAVLKRLKFAVKSEAFNAEQKSLIEETLDTDLAALATEIEAHQPSKLAPEDKQQPKRQVLPAHLPRREIHHEPEDTTCGCGQLMKRMGQDVAEKLDYQPGVFTVERHMRGKWVCACCERLVRKRGPKALLTNGRPGQTSTTWRSSAKPTRWPRRSSRRRRWSSSA